MSEVSRAEIRSPLSAEEWAAYYETRWANLRRPWGIPELIDADEKGGIHLALFSAEGEVWATGRLVSAGPDLAQVRSMAVIPEKRDSGLGRRILYALEDAAEAARVSRVFLHARESAVGFYERCDYRLTGPSYVLAGQIQHFRMEKRLGSGGGSPRLTL